MALMRKGDTYQCPNPDCGCEIKVSKGSSMPESEVELAPKCCCGEHMVQKAKSSNSRSRAAGDAYQGEGLVH
jgi:hypothetical protein